METLRKQDEDREAKRRKIHARAAKAYRERHKKLGLCMNCGNPANGALCGKCKTANNAHQREDYHWKVQQGYCTKNGCWEKSGSTLKCDVHAEWARQYMKNKHRGELKCPVSAISHISHSLQPELQ